MLDPLHLEPYLEAAMRELSNPKNFKVHIGGRISSVRGTRPQLGVHV